MNEAAHLSGVISFLRYFTNSLKLYSRRNKIFVQFSSKKAKLVEFLNIFEREEIKFLTNRWSQGQKILFLKLLASL